MGTGYFPGLRRPEWGVDHPPPSSAEVKEMVELFLYSRYGPSMSVLGQTLLSFYFTSLYILQFTYTLDLPLPLLYFTFYFT
jgi:hypothetical protein